MSFDKLSKAELLRFADEDIAFSLSDEERASKKSILVAFVEADLKFKTYLEANPDQAEKFAPVPPVNTMPEAETEEETKKKTKENLVTAAPDTLLVKMERENPLFEFRRYRFTNKHPYCLMAVEDAQAIMTVEEGFRQAFPSELEEYYS